MERRSFVPMFYRGWLPGVEQWQSLFERAFGGEQTFPLHPTVDVFSREGDFVVEVELAGIDPDKDVEVSVEDDVLVIKGEKSREREVAEADRYLFERSYGSFERRIPLPEGVDVDAISAGYEKGVLTVTAPVVAPAEHAAKKVPVTVR